MKKELEERLEQRAAVIGQKLFEILEPLTAGKEVTDGRKRAERFRDYSVEYTARTVEILDLKRDLKNSRILVLENGSGVLSRRLAAGDTDVVGASPDEQTARLAQTLNQFPSIIHRTLFNPLIEGEFDLIVDSGVLCCYPRSVMEPLVQHLASLCRRKLILQFRLPVPFLERFFGQRNTLDDSDLKIERTQMQETDIVYLLETTCGLIITERRQEAGRMLIKALRRPHSRQAYCSPLK
jgi:hypothetical protein